MNTDALSALTELLGARLSTKRADRDQHGHSETWYAPSPPDAVAWPESTEEVSQILKICSAHRVPVVAYGAGSSLEGHTLATEGGLCLDMARMNRLLAVHEGDMQAIVQPGLTREELNTELRATGLFFPVDPGANASLGGMAATRASGTTTVRYGSMRANVLALEVVLADGRIVRTGSRAAKSSAGYDLTALMLGSEGTLGIITELTLRLHGQPEAVSAAVCAFDSLHAAVETVMATIQLGIGMARIEFVDEGVVEAFNSYAGSDMPLKPHLLVEFNGSPNAVAEEARRFGEVVADMGGADFDWATTDEARRKLWKMRHAAYHACLASRPGSIGLVTDICVPISRLSQAVEETRADIAAEGLVGPILGHVGDGNFHAILLLKQDDADELARARRVAGRMAKRALALGGTVTGEHGIGIGKRAYMQAEHGEGWQVMGAIKAALDPLGILNPGKLVPERAAP
ncbi:FAD-binding oxidoreductase [Phaeovulum sp.]|uniref:FAD-binding oxidoreductase n=1 Tax=Phaeovulum sp. TaxID=2934796 RepID=UPI00356B028C